MNIMPKGERGVAIFILIALILIAVALIFYFWPVIKPYIPWIREYGAIQGNATVIICNSTLASLANYTGPTCTEVPFANASVYLLGTEYKTITDTTGYYSLSKVEVGNYTIVCEGQFESTLTNFTYSGYLSQNTTVAVIADQIAVVNFQWNVTVS